MRANMLQIALALRVPLKRKGSFDLSWSVVIALNILFSIQVTAAVARCRFKNGGRDIGRG